MGVPGFVGQALSTSTKTLQELKKSDFFKNIFHAHQVIFLFLKLFGKSALGQSNLSANRLSVNGLSVNRLSVNRLSVNGLSVNRPGPYKTCCFQNK